MAEGTASDHRSQEGLHASNAIGRPQRSRRWQRTHAAILDSARAHLLEVGPDEFSLREVARRAEYSPAAIYNHFEDREALINTLAMESVQVLGEYMGRVPQELAPKERLIALGTSYLCFAEERPEQYQLVFDLLESPITAWSQYAELAYPFTMLVQAVEDGLRSGQFIDQDAIGAANIAYGLWSMAHGMVMLSYHHLAHIEDDLAPIRRAAFGSFADGLSAPLPLSTPDEFTP